MTVAILIIFVFFALTMFGACVWLYLKNFAAAERARSRRVQRRFAEKERVLFSEHAALKKEFVSLAAFAKFEPGNPTLFSANPQKRMEDRIEREIKSKTIVQVNDTEIVLPAQQQ